MGKSRLPFVIVGHVDHGKSTLIGRLFYDTDSLPEGRYEEIKRDSELLGRNVEFGFVMDHLREEREQGITIDTSQAFFKTEKREYLIVDAPGHREFLKNMITGASHADAAVLIVDVEEGIQEQTRRHAYIISMFGLEQVIVVVNKMDLVGYRREPFGAVRDGLVEMLRRLGMEPLQVVPISAKEGENVARRSRGMEWYEGPTVLEALDKLEDRGEEFDRPLRFPIQDVYRLDGKDVLVGRIETGRLSVGDRIVFYPSGRKSRVKSVEVFLENRSSAIAGESVGITLEEAAFIGRGEVAVAEGWKCKVSDEIRCSIFWVSQRGLDIKTPLVLRCATQEVECAIDSIERRVDSSSLEPIEEGEGFLMTNEAAEVVLRTARPIVAEPFKEVAGLGRVVVVRDREVCGAGIVLGMKDAV